MSLPSQSSRSRAMSRAVVRTHRRKRPRFNPLAAAALILVVGVTATWFFFFREGTPLSPASANAAGSGDEILGDPFTSTAEQSTRPRDEGLNLAGTMSRGERPDERPDDRRAGNPSERPADPPVVISQGTERSGLGESLQRGESTSSVPAESGDERESAPSNPPTTVQIGSPLESARARLDAGDPVAARSILNRVVLDPRNEDAALTEVRALLTEINERLVFSREIVDGDPLTGSYRIQSGDALSRLPSKLGLSVDWRIIQQINDIPDPNRIRLDQEIKLLRGPFHAVVDKSDYRLDLFAGPPEEPGRWTYIRSFRVGLGEDNSTPTGRFVVKRNSKLVNPHWVNPRTGEQFDANDPENPIGERWIGIEGLGDDAAITGYGLHGTIDPDSIGKQRSMGCVRLLDDDVSLVYGMLIEGISRVEILD